MILIVDDKQENLYSLKTLLEINRYEVEMAFSGEEALKKILKNEFELIILDVQMPGMDGYEVAETLGGYSRSKNIPVIFLSAVNIDKRFITKGYASGGVDYVTKPFDYDILLMKVKTFITLYRQASELNEMKENLQQKVEEKTSELLDANKLLAASNNELQQYAFIASHDLQEPLRKIITFSEMLNDKLNNCDEQASKYITKIVDASKRMRTLINDLLEYSKLSHVIKYKSCNLNKILQETISDLEISIAQKNAVFEITEIPEVEGFEEQFRQVFQNIISNALKFSRKEVTPFIKIWSENFKKETYKNESQDFCRIFISDNGIGFNEIYLDKIFSLFQRLHRRDEYEGTGIGLATVKKTIENYQGFITAHSEEGSGSTFIIELPFRQNQSTLN